MKPRFFSFFSILALCAFGLTLSARAQSGRSGVWDANSSNSGASSSSPSQQQQQQYYQGRQRYPQGARYAQNQRTPGQARQQSSAYRYSQQQAGTSQAASSQAARQPQSMAAQAAARGQLLDYNETVNGRRYTVHLPHTYNAKTPLPVVIVFHGLGMNGASVRGLSAMDITAERNGFITVYPDAIAGRWNDGVQPRSTTDDVGFISEMIDAIQRKFRIDSRRVYACGISNGGFFVERLACEISNKIAAIGVVSASGGDAVCARCNTHRGMPIVFFLGTEDPLIPREGETKELGKLGEALGLADLGVKSLSSTVAKAGGLMSANDVAEFWARNNGASAHPREEALPDHDTRDGCKVKRETYSGTSPVVVYTIEGGGHSWPGGMGFVAQDIIGRTCNDISASDIMWQFFQYHSR